MRVIKIYCIIGIMLFLPCVSAEPTLAEDKVAVLITGWGMPVGYNFYYAWTSGDLTRIGDRTEYEGQPCKIGHVGEFPYQSHFNFVPWAILFKTPGYEQFYDSSGVYKYENGMYVSPNPDVPIVKPSDIPAGIPVTPLVQVTQMGALVYPADPRDGTDYLAGWYQIGNSWAPFPNGAHDFKEGTIARFVRWYEMLGIPPDVTDANLQHPAVLAQEEFVTKMLEDSFGDSIDVRFGYYITAKTDAKVYTKLETDVAGEFANEGFTKMLLARETTDNNHYANNFVTGNNVKERLCELEKLDTMQIEQTRQIGRTPEFNTMNVRNLEPFITAYPEGSTIGIVYVTRGLPWNKSEESGPFGMTYPWSKEVYHENAYLNYLSWKKAVKAAFGDKYHLVFTKDDTESEKREDNFFTYGVNPVSDNGGVFKTVRDAIQMAKESGVDKIIFVPCHWNYDNFDTLILTRDISLLPIPPKADLEAGKYYNTHCEDTAGNEVDCDTPDAITITGATSFTYFPEEFATAYYVVLRGTLERFDLHPKDIQMGSSVSQEVKKLDGGVVEATKFLNPIRGAKIAIPADPYPDRPEGFTRETAIPVNDPADTMDCLWEDTVITIAQQLNPPAMNSARPVGPAVHFGPYRTFFNRDVTITIPYRRLLALGKEVKTYIYNHVTKDWDALNVEKAENGLVTFKTQVLGLFCAGVAK